MAERLVTVAGVRLCVETFGVPAAPALLLIGGAAASMDWWDVEFCARLADEGRFVIRYDHRDTGRSEVYPVGEPAYSGADLATDPLRVLDALGIARAHVVGLSMGGGIAQQLAAHHPDRLLTATLIATSAAGERVDQTSLPPMDARLAATFAEPAPQPAWHDRAAVVDYLVEGQRAYAGSLGFDEDRVRRLATIVTDRTRDIAASMTNHWTVAGGASARFRRAAGDGRLLVGERPVHVRRIEEVHAQLHRTVDHLARRLRIGIGAVRPTQCSTTRWPRPSGPSLPTAPYPYARAWVVVDDSVAFTRKHAASGTDR